MKKILVINPGSTSTKIAVYEAQDCLSKHNISHSFSELQSFSSVLLQLDFRKQLILNLLSKDGFLLKDFAMVIGRGGLLPPMASGVFRVNAKMLEVLKRAERGDHASNLGAFLAVEIATQIPHCEAVIADPVAVDELQEVAKISGMVEIPRKSAFHALNQRAVAHRYADTVDREYRDLNLVVAHLGGGITVGAHRRGHVVDVNQGLDGYGAFSPERAGTVDTGELVRLCYSGRYTQDEMLHKLAGGGGLMALLGSSNVQQLVQQSDSDPYTLQCLEAMAYTVGKEIGAMASVLHFEVDAIILTGGIAHNELIVDYIVAMVEKVAPVICYPGEDEMKALAENAHNVLQGTVAIKEFQ